MTTRRYVVTLLRITEQTTSFVVDTPDIDQALAYARAKVEAGTYERAEPWTTINEHGAAVRITGVGESWGDD